MIKHTFTDKLGILKASNNNCNSLKALIVGNPLLLLNGAGRRGGGWGGRSFQKLSHLGERSKILLERGDNFEKGGVHIEMELGVGGVLPHFYYFIVQLHLLCVQEKSKVSFITF